MSSYVLRQYIDILNEADVQVPSRQQTDRRAKELAAKMGVAAPNLIDYDAVGGVAVKINGDQVPSNLYTPQEKQLIATARMLSGGAAAQPAQRDEPEAGGKPAEPTQAAEPAAQEDDRITALQKELKAKGADLGQYGPKQDGVDGKLGPKTRAAAAKFPEIASKYQDVLGSEKPAQPASSSPAAGQAASPAATASGQTTKLEAALGAIEAVLAKYKIKADESIDPLDAAVIENINQYTIKEQLEIWTILAEEEKLRLPPGSKYDRATGNWYVTEPNGSKRILGGTARTTPAQSFTPNEKPKSGLRKFWTKLIGKGFGKKLAARVASVFASGPAAMVVGAGMAIWTAWDIGKALYDTFSTTDFEDLDPTDRDVIKKNLAVIVEYQQDKSKMEQLTPELKVRVERVMKGLNALAVELG